VEETILEFLRTRFRASIGRTAIDRDTRLFSSGIVDSFGVLELIAFLEQQFGIEIDPARHDIEAFDSVARIVSLVSALKTGA
jgi:acyl carrier protein